VDGRVLSWGDADGDALGHSTSPCHVPRLLTSLRGCHVTRGSLSYTNAAVATDQGRLYVWGGNGWEVSPHSDNITSLHHGEAQCTACVLGLTPSCAVTGRDLERAPVKPADRDRVGPGMHAAVLPTALGRARAQPRLLGLQETAVIRSFDNSLARSLALCSNSVRWDVRPH